MEPVYIRVSRSFLPGTFQLMREWLDRHKIILVNFCSTTDENDTVRLHGEFKQAHEATAFYSDFSFLNQSVMTQDFRRIEATLPS